jgi:hypothetical protein
VTEGDDANFVLENGALEEAGEEVAGDVVRHEGRSILRQRRTVRSRHPLAHLLCTPLTHRLLWLRGWWWPRLMKGGEGFEPCSLLEDERKRKGRRNVRAGVASSSTAVPGSRGAVPSPPLINR